jgi:hypothetical protein
MRSVLFLALLTAATLTAHAQTGPGATTPQPATATAQGADEQALTKLDRELMDAVVRGDRALPDRTELDGFVFVNPGGGVEERGQSMPGGPPKFESMVPDEVRVRIHGDTAVLTGRATIKGRLGSGRDISGQYRYLRVYVRRQGQWRLAAASAVPIEQPRPTP